jgi:hypothetical protein
MQLIIEIPDEKVQRLGWGHDRLAQLVEQALEREWSPHLALSDEVVGFLAQGPKPSEIAAFRPSAQSLARVRELLDKNREGLLTPEEAAELDEIGALNRWFSRIKAGAQADFKTRS